MSEVAKVEAEAKAKAESVPIIGPDDLPFSLQEYSKHHSAVFNSLRRQIKKNAPMFAFGDPTPQITMLLFKIYHENILRNLSGAEDKKEEARVNDKGKRIDPVWGKLQCMMGIFEEPASGRGDGRIFITISESPGTVPEDPKKNTPSDELYMQKRRALFNLLKSANITVRFDEEGSPIAREPEVEMRARWRKTPGVTKNNNATNDTDWNSIPNAASIKEKIISRNLNNIMFLDEDFGKADNIVNIYDRRIRNFPMEVHFVDSWKYLTQRRFLMEGDKSTGLYSGKSFKPFKKYKNYKVKVEGPGGTITEKTKWMAECNNGHLCTESKLFAYAHYNNLEARSFVAYWIGGGVPPQHIIRGYCYRTEEDPVELKKLTDGITESALVEKITKSYKDEIKQEKRLLEDLMISCRGPFTNMLTRDKERYPELRAFFASAIQSTEGNSTVAARLEAEPSKLNRVLERVVQPSAVVCPGCFANIQDYKDGKMAMWDGRNCYFSRNSVLSGGKSRKQRKVGRKQKTLKKKIRKHH